MFGMDENAPPVIHLRQKAGRWLVYCHALVTPTNWTDKPSEATCPRCTKEFDG